MEKIMMYLIRDFHDSNLSSFRYFQINLHFQKILKLFSNDLNVDINLQLKKRKKSYINSCMRPLSIYCFEYEVHFEILFNKFLKFKKPITKNEKNDLLFFDLNQNKEIVVDSSQFPFLNSEKIQCLVNLIKILNNSDYYSDRDLDNNLCIKEPILFFYCVCYVIREFGFQVNKNNSDGFENIILFVKDLFSNKKQFFKFTKDHHSEELKNKINQILSLNGHSTIQKSLLLYFILYENENILKNLDHFFDVDDYDEFKDYVLKNDTTIVTSEIKKFFEENELMIELKNIVKFVHVIYGFFMYQKFLKFQKTSEFNKIFFKSKILSNNVGEVIFVNDCFVFFVAPFNDCRNIFVKVFEKNSYNIFCFLLNRNHVGKIEPMMKIKKLSGKINEFPSDLYQTVNNFHLKENFLTRVKIDFENF